MHSYHSPALLQRTLGSIIILVLTTFSARFVHAEPLTVGISLPLSGAWQAHGAEARRGFELGRELLGARDLTLAFEDDACDPAKGITAVKKLLELDKASVLSGIFCNSVLFAAAPVLNRTQVPVISTGANTGDQPSIGAKIFRLFPSSHLVLAPLLDAVAAAGHRTLCMVTETDAYTELIERTAHRSWPARGAEYTLKSESVAMGERDFRSVLQRLVRTKFPAHKAACDAVFINSPGDDGFISAFKQVRSRYPQMPVIALYVPGSSVTQQALGKSLTDTLYGDLPARSDLDTPATARYRTLYAQRYGAPLVTMPIDILAFEALRLIVSAHKQGLPLDTLLRKGPIRDGALPEYSFDSDGAIQGLKFVVRRMGAE